MNRRILNARRGRSRLALVLLYLTVSACGTAALTPANVAAEPGGTLALSFTRTFPPGFWSDGDHAYRLVIECPTQRIGPPVTRFEVSEDAPEVGTVYLRFDGPGRNLMSPADTPVVNPSDTTIAVITLAGMTPTGAEDARSGCAASVVYDGLDAETLEPGSPFSP